MAVEAVASGRIVTTENHVGDAIAPQNTRLKAMARQIEKLSWILEKTFEWYVVPEYGFEVEEMEAEWQRRTCP
jgi:hypothetical protein